MSKAVKGFLIAAFCLILVGCILGFYGWFNGGAERWQASGWWLGTEGNASSARSEAVIDRTLPGEVSSLIVHSGAANVNIYQSSDNDIHINATGFFEDELSTSLSGGEFVLEDHAGNSVFSGIHLGPFRIGFGENGRPYAELTPSRSGSKLEINLYIPSKMYDKIHISNDVGRMRSHMDLQADEIILNIDVGDAEYQALSAESYLEIHCSVGRLSMESAIAPSVSINADVGETNIKNLTASERINLKGGVGRVSLERCALNNAGIDLGVGDFSCSGTIAGNSRIQQGVGSVRITIDDSIENYKLTFDKGLGSFRATQKGQSQETSWSVLNDDEYFLGSLDAPNQLTVDGGLGDFSVDFAK